ncbi:MAG: hypothetical protein ACNYNY_00755 [Candidatus Oxydemutatoraceae bacterium WSBS_2016_MAG_OTU14]
MSAIATTICVSEDYPYSQSQSSTVGVTAVVDTIPDSQEVRTSVLPPKLLSEFFTVTPSSTRRAWVWNPLDAVLQGGVNFYEATRVDNLGSLTGSILLISIEDPDGGEIIARMEVSARRGRIQHRWLGRDNKLCIGDQPT